MASISKIQLPAGVSYDIHDSRISGIDTAPTSGSTKLVQSGGVYTALTDKVDKSIQFTNPVGAVCPDPCFWKGDDGYYYVKGTGRTFTVKRTKDFVSFENTGRIFITDTAQDSLFTKYGHYATDDPTYKLHPNYWAPYVIKIGDKWVMYMAIVEQTGTKSSPTATTAHIVAFTARTPYGDFDNPITIVSDNEIPVNASGTVLWKNVIDPFVYCDPYDNHLYLLAGSSYSIRRKRLTDDGLAVYQDGSGVAIDNYAMHCAGRTIDNDGTRATVYEGAYLYSKTFGNRTLYYLFVSAGSYDQRNYCVKVGRVEYNSKPLGGATIINYYDQSTVSMRSGGGTTILSTESDSSTFWGPGHIGGIIEGSDGRTFMIYHCHTGSGGADRRLFIQEIFWDSNGWPYFENNGHPVASGTISKEIITDSTVIEQNILAGANQIVVLTQSEYTALSTKDPNTLYFIK